MLKMGKNNGTKINKSKNILIGLFAIGVLTGVGVPLFGATDANTVNAATAQVSASALPASSGAAVTYTYQKISTSDAYPMYVAASFASAGGLFLFALTFVPVRKRNQSRYASRVTTWAKNTY